MSGKDNEVYETVLKTILLIATGFAIGIVFLILMTVMLIVTSTFL